MGEKRYCTLSLPACQFEAVWTRSDGFLLIRQLIIEYSHPLTHSRNLFPLPWERARERATSQRLVCRVSENVQYLVAESIGASFMRTITLCFDKANRTYAVGRLKRFQTAFGFIFQSLIHVLRMALALSWLKACRPSEALVFEWIIDSAINYWIFTSSYPQQKPVPSPVGEG